VSLARPEQLRRPQQAANMIGAKRRSVSNGHLCLPYSLSTR
jgi:hypothetical protein